MASYHLLNAGVYKFERDFYCVVESDADQDLAVNVVRTGDGTAASTISKWMQQEQVYLNLS